MPFFLQQTGEYATDDEEAGTTVAGEDKSIEVFDLPETEDILSPSELDATKLYQKFREVNPDTFSSTVQTQLLNIPTQLMGAHHIFLCQCLKEYI